MESSSYRLIKNVYFSIPFLLLLTGCETLINDVDPKKLPQSKTTVVLNSYISPQDSVLTVKAQYSVGVFGEFSTNIQSPLDKNIPTNLKITLSDGNSAVNFVFNSKDRLYRADVKKIPILSGKTYQLRAEDTDGKVYTASTTVPNVLDFEVLNPVLERSYSGGGNPQFQFKSETWIIPIKWNAPANTFYRIGVWDIKEVETKLQNGSIQKLVYNPANSFFNSQFIQNSEKIAKSFTSNIQYFLNQNINTGLGNNTTEKYLDRFVRMLMVDENYYKYHKSVQNNNGDNPFVEPTLVFSNITNGFGCFGSFNMVDKKFELK